MRAGFLAAARGPSGDQRHVIDLVEDLKPRGKGELEGARGAPVRVVNRREGPGAAPLYGLPLKFA